MTQVIWIGFAGALGTLCRHFVGMWAGRTLGVGFPYATLIVNVAGCFLIALVFHLATTSSLVSSTMRAPLTTGFIGGLTTYSSFNYETTQLLRERAWITGTLNVGLTLVACFVAGLLGVAVARHIAAS